MHKEKDYSRVIFPPEVIRQAVDELDHQFGEGRKRVLWKDLRVSVDGEEWWHDSVEEFFADYRRSKGQRLCSATVHGEKEYDTLARLDISVYSFSDDTTVLVKGPERAGIEKVFEVFEAAAPSFRMPEPEKEPTPPPPKPVIFIGHGHSEQWRDLKDHLHDKHMYEVEAYEIGARAGHAIRDVLEDMLKRSSFALLVMTGEDEQGEGALRARQNVVHEIGLFQGRLGFRRAVVLVEAGTEIFSNIQGVEQIRFSQSNIKEVFGEVLATLRREFPSS